MLILYVSMTHLPNHLILAQSEKQTASSGIWTRVSDFIFNDDNCYAKLTLLVLKDILRVFWVSGKDAWNPKPSFNPKGSSDQEFVGDRAVFCVLLFVIVFLFFVFCFCFFFFASCVFTRVDEKVFNLIKKKQRKKTAF